MHGNVWEWVEDDFHGTYKGAPTDGSAWVDKKKGIYRVIRGGSWDLGAQFCRTATRYRFQRSSCYGYLGFRLAKSVTISP